MCGLAQQATIGPTVLILPLSYGSIRAENLAISPEWQKVRGLGFGAPHYPQSTFPCTSCVYKHSLSRSVTHPQTPAVTQMCTRFHIPILTKTVLQIHCLLTNAQLHTHTHTHTRAVAKHTHLYSTQLGMGQLHFDAVWSLLFHMIACDKRSEVAHTRAQT